MSDPRAIQSAYVGAMLAYRRVLERRERAGTLTPQQKRNLESFRHAARQAKSRVDEKRVQREVERDGLGP